MTEQDKRAIAVTQLSDAIAAVADAGPLRHAHVVSARVERDGGFTNVQAVIFTESPDLGAIIAARLNEPTTAERAGLPPNPPFLDGDHDLVSEGAGLGVESMTIEQLNERANLLASEMDANDEENRAYQREIDKIYARIDATKS
ncbi:hypothetical protein LGM58_43175 [Burkholderia contaminans]|uniref:hypothetical protein n=1 Tax=Burkholderia contaminans TaxID=488447 RepID=UPI001CF44443|nr:hypothetical protein [Burkholderia contaminans]MCA7889979.1 hypothetical protein [Burkholderia contaminans]